MALEHICHFLWDLRNSSDSGGARITEGLRFASFGISVITCVLGIFGNSVVIWVTACKMRHVKAMTWFFNLAVADLLFLVCLPMRAISLIMEQWHFGWPLCKLYHFLSNLNMYVSIFILTALSIDRCLSVALPLWHRKHESQQYIPWACMILWLITTAMSIPGLLYSNIETFGNTTQCALGFHRKNTFNFQNVFMNSSECFPTVPTTELTLQYNIETSIIDLWTRIENGAVPQTFADLPFYREGCQKFFNRCINTGELEKWQNMLAISDLLIIPLLIIGFLIPLIIITLTNIITAIKTKGSLTKMTSKLYTLIVAMVITFFVAWTPLALVETVFLIAAHHMDFQLMHHMITVLPLVSSIACFHSCLNPILYVLLSKSAKQTIRDSLDSLWKSLIPSSVNTSQRNGTES